MRNNPLVSVLVHTRNSQRTIKRHLDSIKNQSYKNLEIIVVDNNSTDKTLIVAKLYTKKIFTFGPERSAQRNYAAKKASGDYYLVPDSDMILEKDVVLECVNLVKNNKTVKAVVVPEKSIGQGFWAKCKALERSFYVGVPWMEGARFFSRKVFQEMGGYDETNTGTEDYDLPQRIKGKYGEKSIANIDEFILHDEGKLSLITVLKKKFYYGQKLDVYKKGNVQYYKKQSSVVNRYLLFFSKPKKILHNPILGLGLFFMKTSEFAALGMGYLFRKKYKFKLYGKN